MKELKKEQKIISHMLVRCPNCNAPKAIGDSITGCSGWIVASAFFNCNRCGYEEKIGLGKVWKKGAEFIECWRYKGLGCIICDKTGKLKVERILKIEAEL